MHLSLCCPRGLIDCARARIYSYAYAPYGTWVQHLYPVAPRTAARSIDTYRIMYSCTKCPGRQYFSFLSKNSNRVAAGAAGRGRNRRRRADAWTSYPGIAACSVAIIVRIYPDRRHQRPAADPAATSSAFSCVRPIDAVRYVRARRDWTYIWTHMTSGRG